MTVDDDLNQAFDAFMRRHGYRKRSEAFRNLLRDRLEQLERHRHDDGGDLNMPHLYHRV
jgi:metal-responsive CopG/Arc/MetJ family transcriptional regulator